MILALFVAVALVPALLGPPGREASAEPRGTVPAEALAALREGRYWRASRILHQHLSSAPDTAPRTLLLVAQADAGWGDWAGVQRLLSDRPWLDSVSGGYGWKLLGQSFYQQGDFDQGSAALSHYLDVAQGTDARERGLTEIRRAFAAQKAGHPADAVTALDDAAKLLPRLGDWIALWGAQAAAQAGDTAAVEKRLAAAGGDLARSMGWRTRVRAQRSAGATGRALALAEDAAGYLSSAADRATAWRIAGDIRLEKGDTTAARAAYTRAIEASSSSEAALDAARQLSQLEGLRPEDQLRIGRVYLRNGNRERGVEGLQRYLAGATLSATERAEIQLELGRALFSSGRYDDVARRMLALADSSPSARIGSEAMYLAARAQYRAGDRDDAIRTLNRTAARFKGQPAVVRANFLIADLAHDRGDIAEAQTYYRRAIEADPGVDEAGLSVMRLAGIQMLQGDARDAASIFAGYLESFPNGRRAQQSAYFEARALREQGRGADADAMLRKAWREDPFSFYGWRAAGQLGIPADSIPLEPSPDTTAGTQAELAAAMGRIDLLRELDRPEAVNYEIDRVRQHFAQRDGGDYLVAEALNARGMTVAGVNLGWQIRRTEGGWNRRLLRIIYPMPYGDILVGEAEEQGLDPWLVAGLIRQESLFDAAITSGAGAEGLMQIMPATGATLARAAGIGDFETPMLHRPEVNIHLGTRYFAQLLDRFDGNVTAALAAYNAGPNRIVRWRELPEWKDEELFIERIPYDETRDYVKRVQQNQRVYRFLYGDSSGEGA